LTPAANKPVVATVIPDPSFGFVTYKYGINLFSYFSSFIVIFIIDILIYFLFLAVMANNTLYTNATGWVEFNDLVFVGSNVAAHGMQFLCSGNIISFVAATTTAIAITTNGITLFFFLLRCWVYVVKFAKLVTIVTFAVIAENAPF
jgi:hypothetical protein